MVGLFLWVWGKSLDLGVGVEMWGCEMVFNCINLV